MAVTKPVSLVRAVLTVHVQTSINRMVKQLGPRSPVVLAVLAGLLFLVGIFPTLAGIFAATFFSVSSLRDNGSVTPQALFGSLGSVLTLIALAGGLVGGVSGGGRQLMWEQYQCYPVRTITLFIAELVACLGDIITALAVSAIGLMCLAVTLAMPSMVLGLLLVAVQLVLMMLSIQLIVGSLAEQIVKRFRLALGLTIFGAWLIGNLLTGSEVTQGINPDRLAMLRTIAGRFVSTVQILPATQSLLAANRGEWSGHLPQLAISFMLVPLAFVLLWRERDDVEQAKSNAKERLWSFSNVRMGLARLQLQTLMSSMIGKFGFLMPVVTVVLIRGPLSHLGGQATWALPAAFIYTALAGNGLSFNQFGLDGHGVKGLFLLPVSERDILVGKQLGLLALQGAQALLLAVLLMLERSPQIDALLAGLCLSVCVFLVQNVVGQRTSVWMPRRFHRGGVKHSQVPIVVGLIALATTLGCGAIYMGAFIAVFTWARVLLLPAMVLLVIVTWLVVSMFWEGNARYLAKHKERVISAIG